MSKTNSKSRTDNQMIDQIQTLKYSIESNKEPISKEQVDIFLNDLIDLLKTKKLNKISIRVISNIGITYNEKFNVILSKEKVCSILYKDNDKCKPVTCYFYLNDDNQKSVDEIMKICEMKESYIFKNNNMFPYILFFRGHIYKVYKDIDEVFYECLSKGNLKLYKRDYENKNENYKIQAVIDDKNFE